MIHRAFRVISSEEDLLTHPSRLTLREFWRDYFLADFSDLSAASIASDRNALNNFERYCSTPDRPCGPLLGEIRSNSPLPLKLKNGLLDKGASGSTVRKNWRELKAILELAAEKGFCEVPQLPRRRAICRASQEPHRELLTEEIFSHMWENCRRVSYPDRSHKSQLLWRVLLSVAWSFGPRTMDLINLKWDSFLLSDGLLRFRAGKTGKLQGLPLPECLREILLWWREIEHSSDRMFPGLVVRGHYDHQRQRWINGWRAVIRRDLNHGIDPPVKIQNFRQLVVTRWRETGVGSWIAGHSERGVSDRHYTEPSSLVREVIARWVPPVVMREFADGRHWVT